MNLSNKYPIITLQKLSINCDNNHCDYTEEDIPRVNLEQHINRECPKCGSNLLTEADYVTYMKFIKFANRINKIFNIVIPDFLLKRWTKNEVIVESEMDGSGKLGLKVKE